MYETEEGKFDLNLLVVFDAVMAEGSVKKAAVRLGMNSPAVSQAMGRLKDAVGAELFSRSGHGVRPTPRAVNMWDGVRVALELINSSVSESKAFDPQTETRIIQIDLPAGTDAVITPKLAQRVEQSPGLQFRISNSRALNVLNDLRFGDSWLACDYRPISEPGYHCEVLTEQEVVLLASANHPALVNGLTKDLYQTLPQVAVAAVRTTSVLPVTERLEAVGIMRVVKYTVPGLLNTLALISQRGLVVSLPYCTALLCMNWADVKIHRLPFEMAKIPLFMVWHERFDNDCAHSWLPQTLREICAEL